MIKSGTIRNWALLRVGDPYIFAAAGQKCTPEFREQQEKNKPAYAAAIKKYCPVRSGRQATCAGCKYNGRPSHDCSGLTKEAGKLIGMTLPHGASSLWKGNYWDVKGPIAQMPLNKVCFVFNDMPSADPMGHVGIYLGDGYVVDSRGHAQGTMHTKLSSYAWDHYGILKGTLNEEGGTNMPDMPIEVTLPTLRKGSKGAYVAQAQQLLLYAGQQLPRYGVDGEFGAETEAAVRAFQAARGLTADSIVGPVTWAALLAPAAPLPATYTVTIPNLTQAQADALVAQWPGATKVVG